ncbi:hypothetical protein [Mesorhizobium caraganae]|uniref:hypothetical protein n=1 Tax=Mesorhizobium caraganae TaxID=483206 RepID=UPI00333A7D16
MSIASPIFPRRSPVLSISRRVNGDCKVGFVGADIGQKWDRRGEIFAKSLKYLVRPRGVAVSAKINRLVRSTQNGAIETVGVSSPMSTHDDLPAGSTGICHESTSAIDEAARLDEAARASLPSPSPTRGRGHWCQPYARCSASALSKSCQAMASAYEREYWRRWPEGRDE